MVGWFVGCLLGDATEKGFNVNPVAETAVPLSCSNAISHRAEENFDKNEPSEPRLKGIDGELS